MALRLGDFLEIGELSNFEKNSVFGRLKIRGVEQTIIVELTGNFDEDLRGKYVGFEPGKNPHAPPPATMSKEQAKAFAKHQVGATGTMTAARVVKLPTLPIHKFIDLPKDEKDQAVVSVNSLYLEWYSQNGRVVIELADPELNIRDSFPDYSAEEKEAEEAIAEALAGEVDEEFSLFPSGEDSDLEAGESTDEDDDADAALKECELMDDLIDNELGVQMRSLLSPELFESDIEELPEEKAEQLLKLELAQLALQGIALHMCEHYSCRDALKLLMDKLGREARVHKELRGTGWVTNYMTSEFCPQCEAQFEAEFEEFEKKRKAEGPEEDNSDVPF